MTSSARTEAWQALYDAHAARLWRNVAQRISHQADVADVVQETLFAAARNFLQFDPNRGSAWNWLWGIGHRQVAIYYRRRGSLPVSDVEVESLAAFLEGEAHAAVVRAEWGELLRRGLAALSTEHDALLTARYLEDRSVEDLAHEACTTSTAIRSKLARARGELREELLRRTPSLQGEPS
jgi:RNA polymerase sigma-70 factor (ECF subfamily)